MVPSTNIGPAIHSHIARGLMLYQGMRDEGVGKAELARLGMAPVTSRPGTGRLTPVAAGHDGRALGAIGQRMHVTALVKDD